MTNAREIVPATWTNCDHWFSAPISCRHSLGRWAFLLLVCSYFALSYASLPLFLDMNLYTHGLERTPYQYRVLPMFAFRALVHSPLLLIASSHLAAPFNDPYRVIMAVIAFTSLLAATVATSATIFELTSDKFFAQWASLLVVLWAQLDLAYAWDDPFTTPYDVPSLMFFAVMINLVVRQKWFAYYPVFVLAVFNRETACFATVFFMVWRWSSLKDAGGDALTRLRRIAPHLLSQLALWIVIKLVLAFIFSGNPEEIGGLAGGLFITHVGYNLRELLKPQQWPLLASVCGFSLPFIWLTHRRIGVTALTRSIFVILPLSFAALLVVGRVVEIRIFADWIGLLVPAAAMIVWNSFQPRPEIRHDTNPDALWLPGARP